jgi:Xaa-Pro aminopeptidase
MIKAMATIEESDREFAVALSELRLVKDAFEIAQMRQACDRPRWPSRQLWRLFPRPYGGAEASAGLRASSAYTLGMSVTPSAMTPSLPPATTRAHCTGFATTVSCVKVNCYLLDAGIELDSLYTADITRTVPISGTFSDEQRMVYDAVYEASRRALLRPVLESGSPRSTRLR